MTKEKFFVEFNSVTEEAEKQFSIKHLCTEIGIGRSVYYRWKNGRNAPIRIAREAVVHLLRGLILGPDVSDGPSSDGFVGGDERFQQAASS